jgi:AcrR family transcriptional regulator
VPRAPKRPQRSERTGARRAAPAGRRSARGAGGGEGEPTTRERILAAALHEFAERGFEGARTRAIAERAGANLGLITYYFDTKEKLWRGAVSRAFEELGAELAQEAPPRPSRDGGGGRAHLERLLRRFVRFVARRPEFMRLMNDEGKRDSARMRWLADHHVRPMAGALRELVERAQAEGALPPLPASSVHYIALGAAGLVFSQAPECARVTGADATSDAFAEAHADAVVRLLLGPPPGTNRA